VSSLVECGVLLTPALRIVFVSEPVNFLAREVARSLYSRIILRLQDAKPAGEKKDVENPKKKGHVGKKRPGRARAKPITPGYCTWVLGSCLSLSG
jgi:hypothetical protein